MAGQATEQEIVQRVNTWASAERHGNADVLADLLAPEFVGVGPYGFLLTYEQWLNRFRSGDFRNTALTLDDLNVRLFGDAAIVIGQQRSEAAYQGRPTGGHFRATLIFVRQRDAWRLAGLQYSSIATPPAA